MQKSFYTGPGLTASIKPCCVAHFSALLSVKQPHANDASTIFYRLKLTLPHKLTVYIRL